MNHLLDDTAMHYRYQRGTTPAGEAYRAWVAQGTLACRQGKTSQRIVLAPEGERVVLVSRIYFAAGADVLPGDAVKLHGKAHRVVGAVLKAVGGRISHVEADVIEMQEPLP
jgi:hypothetical protein